MTFMNVIGPDVSFHNDNNNTPQGIDFKKMKAAGAYFVIIRSGQNQWTDPDFLYNWRAAKEAGLPRGAYFFYDDRVPPEAQAVLFWSLVVQDPPELGLWLDLERDYGGAYKGWGNWKKCLEKLRSLTSSVGIYTGPSYWMTHRPTGAADLAFFRSLPLWIANYGVTDPLIPSPWSYCLFWQYGTPSVGLEYGVESLEIDMNIFNGDAATFRNYFQLGGEVVTPPQEGNTMAYRYEATNLYDNMALRPEHNTNNTKIASYPHGQKFRGDSLFVATVPLKDAWGNVFQMVGDTWLKVSDVNGIPVNGWVAVIHLSYRYCNLTDFGPVTPPVPSETSPDYVVLHWASGVEKRYIPE